MMLEDRDKRQEIGDRLISGIGYEIGAGASLSQYLGMKSITYLDKRDRTDLEQLFNSSIPYDVHSIDDQHVAADFVIAHHVIEHAADPIGTIVRWSSLIKDGGRMFLSLPAADNPCEKDRLPTPFEHILDDYLFGRGPDHFDSKQHILHFINQWAVMDLANFWYAKLDVTEFATVSLSEVRRDGHDLHWHTYTIETFKQVMETAFWFAGHDIAFCHAEHGMGCIYIVAAKGATSRKMPDYLRPHHDRLARTAAILRDRQ